MLSNYQNPSHFSPILFVIQQINRFVVAIGAFNGAKQTFSRKKTFE
jgi:hypothetical protein